MSSDSYLSENEFKELDDKDKWNYVKSVFKLLEHQNIKAEKNCVDCEKTMLSASDINIDLLFEDFRECQNNCDKCSKEERVYMCDLQFQLMSHLYQTVFDLQNKLNGFVKLMLKKGDKGKKLVSNIQKAIDDKESRSGNMFL